MILLGLQGNDIYLKKIDGQSFDHVRKEGIRAIDIYTGSVYENNIIDSYYSICNGFVRVLSMDDVAQSFVATE